MADNPRSRVYLGDSVYAEYEGGELILCTNNGLGDNNTIYLDEYVIEALLMYLRQNGVVLAS